MDRSYFILHALISAVDDLVESAETFVDAEEAVLDAREALDNAQKRYAATQHELGIARDNFIDAVQALLATVETAASTLP